ncbi:hypothetical protein [Roseibium sp. RKSG952]|uniref:hypothetical protein n=1 Tax=Roseibium sp. RKSG952 TaxID=2529384 RepID=UPI0012BCDE4E|nr:hypothetical protein [Roseibium sp. RKSG952]MTI00602.1 hypothetical protein [Roseibium sp. RKSG952]
MKTELILAGPAYRRHAQALLEKAFASAGVAFTKRHRSAFNLLCVDAPRGRVFLLGRGMRMFGVLVVTFSQSVLHGGQIGVLEVQYLDPAGADPASAADEAFQLLIEELQAIGLSPLWCGSLHSHPAARFSNVKT